VIPLGIVAASSARRVGEADPHWQNVVSLLKFDDVNAPWQDAKGVAWVPRGSPQLDGSNKKFGIGSLGLNGSSHLEAVDTAFNFGTGDYTVEAFVRDANNSNRGVFTNRFASTHAGTTGVAIDSNTRLFVQNNGTATIAEISGGLPSRFFHVAIARHEGVLRMFCDGVLRLTRTDNTPLVSGEFYIGGYYSTAFRMFGNIDEFRVTRGVARYTAGFTPPTSPFPTR
jgi:hypothetical protein